jgi:hypothetical protein
MESTVVALGAGVVGGLAGVMVAGRLRRHWARLRHWWLWRGYARDPRRVYERNLGPGSWQRGQDVDAWMRELQAWERGGKKGVRPPPPPVAMPLA